MQSACAVLYCHLWPVGLYHNFPTLCDKDTKLKQSVTEHKICVLIFSTNLSKTFLILRRIQRDIIINVYSYLRKVPIILIKFQSKMKFSQQIFEKQTNIKFNENPSSGSQVVACGQTDRQTDRQTDIQTDRQTDRLKRNNSRRFKRPTRSTYVHICVYIYTYIHTTYILTHTYIYIYIHTSTYIHIYSPWIHFAKWQ
jgi:hypothetical protein